MDQKTFKQLLDTYVSTFESDVNYKPYKIDLSAKDLSKENLLALFDFIKQPRKRLFIFKVADKEKSDQLELIARQYVLDYSAKNLLKTSTQKTNPLKQALTNTTPPTQPAIQIHRVFHIDAKKAEPEAKTIEIVSEISAAPIVESIETLTNLDVLKQQLATLGITHIQIEARSKVQEFSHLFQDGVVISNLPKGLYIDKATHALCYTKNPKRYPTALAPSFESVESFKTPTDEQATFLCNFDASLRAKLLSSNLEEQKSAIISLFPSSVTKETQTFFNNLKAEDAELIIPLLANQLIYGGADHARLLQGIIKDCLAKSISIKFLRDPLTQEAILNPNGIRNLQKISSLTLEQREWWSTLADSHLEANLPFDFDAIYEGFAHVFIPQIKKHNLTLPRPCPIKHKGHILITLNRALEVIDLSANPQEQSRNLENLNWGFKGAQFAVTVLGFKQVAARMELNDATKLNLEPANIFPNLTNTVELNLWIARYIGKYWKAGLSWADVDKLLSTVQDLLSWSQEEKDKLKFIFAASFPETDSNTLQPALTELIESVLNTNDTTRTRILNTLTSCYKFKPIPSLQKLTQLSGYLKDFSSTNPDNLADEFARTLASCLENERFELLTSIQERVAKVYEAPNVKVKLLPALVSYLSLIDKNRGSKLTKAHIKLITALNEDAFDNTSLESLFAAFDVLTQKKGKLYADSLLTLLASINIPKSQNIPKLTDILSLITNLSKSTEAVQQDTLTQDIRNAINNSNLLAGTILGAGDLSQLNNLIVTAFVDSAKKRAQFLDLPWMISDDGIKKQINIAPKTYMLAKTELISDLEKVLFPLLKEINELLVYLQDKNNAPQLDEIIARLEVIESDKNLPAVLEHKYSLIKFVGKTFQFQGKDLLNLIFKGKTQGHDDSKFFKEISSGALVKLRTAIDKFLIDPAYKDYFTDLNTDKIIAWLVKFSETHNILFLFEEELINKKIKPVILNTIAELNAKNAQGAPDEQFKQDILEAVESLDSTKKSHEAIKDYRQKIEGIEKYLTILGKIKDLHGYEFFQKIYKLLQQDPYLSKIKDFGPKQKLLEILLQYCPQDKIRDLAPEYLKLISEVLQTNSNASSEDFLRAVLGLETLFSLDLDINSTSLFKMSIAHNLRSKAPFPIQNINKINLSKKILEKDKPIIVKLLIKFLSEMKTDDLSSIEEIIKSTTTFLETYPEKADLCVALLKRFSFTALGPDTQKYTKILEELMRADLGTSRDQLANNIQKLASNKQDDTVNIAVLYEILTGLTRRSPEKIKRVTDLLFDTAPYPEAFELNSILLQQTDDKLDPYCTSFDINPFAKPGKVRDFAKDFATDRVKSSLESLKDLLRDEDITPSLKADLARQLNYIQIIGYTDPLEPDDFSKPKKLTALPRKQLRIELDDLIANFKKVKTPKEREILQLKILAYMREIYFRSVGLFPNTSQMLSLLLSLRMADSDLLMGIKTGEGKSIISPMLVALQSILTGGTIASLTANQTLLHRDFEKYAEPFFKFLGLNSSVIQFEQETFDHINCSTFDEAAHFILADKLRSRDKKSDTPISLIIDECDDPLYDKTTPGLYSLIKEHNGPNHAEWVYPLAYQFLHSDVLKKLKESKEVTWDDDDLIDLFRAFLNSEIAAKFNGNAEKQNAIMAYSNLELKQLINVSCQAATLVEDKHYIIQSEKTDPDDPQSPQQMFCVPLIHSTPKKGCIFLGGLQQAVEAKLIAEYIARGEPHSLKIRPYPEILASLSARGLIEHCKSTGGRLIGISGTPGSHNELQSLTTNLNVEAIGLPPHAGDNRKKSPPIFTRSFDETVLAIRKNIDKRRVAVTKAPITADADTPVATLEEQQGFIQAWKEDIKEWSKTQNQPILIVCEDFSEAKKFAEKLDDYKRQGFKIQVVTGKETKEEHSNIIKAAGEPNTITIITDTRGVDIDPGVHPKGLLVIQTFINTERITMQIAGRAARNGKLGEWLAIFQVKGPQAAFKRFFYSILPWWQRRVDKNYLDKVQNKIIRDSSVTRLYSKAIDEALEILIAQVEDWEKLLLQLYPEYIQHEFYLWRTSLLSEIASLQEFNVEESSLEASIANFKLGLCRIWEENQSKWIKKAEEAVVKSENDSAKIRFEYLKSLNLSKELDAQKLSPFNSTELNEATNALTDQTLETVILDKAGTALYYEDNLDENQKTNLKLSQSKQLLPYLIAEFCFVYPAAFDNLKPKTNSSLSLGALLPNFVKNFTNKLIQKKNKLLAFDKERIIKGIVDIFKTNLKTSPEEVKELLIKMRPLILDYHKELKKQSLVEQFKMQGLLNSFVKLYSQAGLVDEEAKLADLSKTNRNEMVKILAGYLQAEFSWTIQKKGLHKIERSAGTRAATSIFDLANKISVQKDLPNEKDINQLIALLHTHKVILKNTHILSLSHSNPETVINTALAAIDALSLTSPQEHKDYKQYRENALCAYHRNKFSKLLTKITIPRAKKSDEVWMYLDKNLNSIPDKPHTAAQFIMLEQTLERFSHYEAYKPYKRRIARLQAEVKTAIKALQKAGFEKVMEDELLAQVSADCSSKLDGHVIIQRKFNGLKSYIEMQTDSEELQDKFVKYTSSSRGATSSRASVEAKKAFLEANKNLAQLADISVLNGADFPFSDEEKEKFGKLFKLKSAIEFDDSKPSWKEKYTKFMALNIATLNNFPAKVIPLYDVIRIFNSVKLDSPQGRTELAALKTKFEKLGPLIETLEANLKLSSPESKAQAPVEQLKKQASQTKILQKVKEKLHKKDGTATPPEAPAPVDNNVLKNIEESKEVIIFQIYSLFIDSILKEAKQTFNNLQTKVNEAEITIQDIEVKEKSKARFQTRFFANSSELLDYTASIFEEKASIPDVKPSKSRYALFHKSEKPAKPATSSPEPVVDPGLGDAPGVS